MNITLSLLTPITLIVATMIHHIRTRLTNHQQRRCIAHIGALIGRDHTPQKGEIAQLRRRYTSSTIQAAINTVIRSLRGAAVERAIVIGKGCNLQILPILHRPDHAIVYISKIGRQLSLCEIAHLTSMLVAYNAPLAYTPLLSSRNHNLRLIGLYLVYHFGFVDAERLVQHALQTKEPTISNVAAHTLCSICGNLHTHRVVSHFEHLSAHHRHALLRHAVQACYSPQSVAHLLSAREREEFEGRVSSYKCSILCS